jgi:hypothetical protein
MAAWTAAALPPPGTGSDEARFSRKVCMALAITPLAVCDHFCHRMPAAIPVESLIDYEGQTAGTATSTSCDHRTHTSRVREIEARNNGSNQAIIRRQCLSKARHPEIFWSGAVSRRH